MHATYVKVAYWSGAGLFINEVDKNMKEQFVLASDGSSHDVLDYFLHKAILAF